MRDTRRCGLQSRNRIRRKPCDPTRTQAQLLETRVSPIRKAARRMMIKSWFLGSSALVALLALPLSSAQQRPERTLDEIKTEAVHRAENGMYPLIGLDPGDVREAFTSIHTKDKDEWAAAFMGVADRYWNEAKTLEKSDPGRANSDYIRAWRLYSFG